MHLGRVCKGGACAVALESPYSPLAARSPRGKPPRGSARSLAGSHDLAASSSLSAPWTRAASQRRQSPALSSPPPCSGSTRAATAMPRRVVEVAAEVEQVRLPSLRCSRPLGGPAAAAGAAASRAATWRWGHRSERATSRSLHPVLRRLATSREAHALRQTHPGALQSRPPRCHPLPRLQGREDWPHG